MQTQKRAEKNERNEQMIICHMFFSQENITHRNKRVHKRDLSFFSLLLPTSCPTNIIHFISPFFSFFLWSLIFPPKTFFLISSPYSFSFTLPFHSNSFLRTHKVLSETEQPIQIHTDTVESVSTVSALD